MDADELDYLYALYKSSQRGVHPSLSKEELAKLIESGKFDLLESQKDENNKPEKLVLGIPETPKLGTVKYYRSS